MAEIENIDGPTPEIRDTDGPVMEDDESKIIEDIDGPLLDNQIIDDGETEKDLLVDKESGVKKSNKEYKPKVDTKEELQKYTSLEKCSSSKKFDDSYLNDDVEEEHVFCKFPERPAAKKSLKEYLEVEDETLSIDLKVKEPRSFSPVKGSSKSIDTKMCKSKNKKTIREDDLFYEVVEGEASKDAAKKKSSAETKSGLKFGEPKIPVRYNRAAKFLHMYKRVPRGRKVHFEKKEEPAPKNKSSKDKSKEEEDNK